MTIAAHSEEGQIVRQLIPLSALSTAQFNTLCLTITIENSKAGDFLFKRNDNITELIYLINGSISLQSDDLIVDTIESGTESARFALAHQIPRKIDAYTNTAVRFLRLNSDVLNALPSISLKENTTMFDDELEIDDKYDDDGSDDWMATLLKSPIFRGLPPANLQQIISKLEEVKYEKGDLVIKQGDSGDFYYLIKKGCCLLSRRPSPNSKEVRLAQLRDHDTFGEDSLLSGEPRNVNITAQTNMSLLRLSKDNFISLIKQPSLKFIPYSGVENEIVKGAILLDVRTPDEYKKYHLPNSINTPFFSLRMQLNTFKRGTPVLVICADGKTSEAAAFLLLRHKISALIIKGGMEKAPKAIEIPEIIEEIEFVSEAVETPETIEKPKLIVEKVVKLEEPGSLSDLQEITQSTLEAENQQLKQEIKKLTTAKNELEKKYLVLYKQTEKLKAVLDKIKIS